MSHHISTPPVFALDGRHGRLLEAAAWGGLFPATQRQPEGRGRHWRTEYLARRPQIPRFQRHHSAPSGLLPPETALVPKRPAHSLKSRFDPVLRTVDKIAARSPLQRAVTAAFCLPWNTT